MCSREVLQVPEWGLMGKCRRATDHAVVSPQRVTYDSRKQHSGVQWEVPIQAEESHISICYFSQNISMLTETAMGECAKANSKKRSTDQSVGEPKIYYYPWFRRHDTLVLAIFYTRPT
jgi:hypothetical protein